MPISSPIALFESWAHYIHVAVQGECVCNSCLSGKEISVRMANQHWRVGSGTGGGKGAWTDVGEMQSNSASSYVNDM
jgi:erythromycin esterase-like protein